METYKLEKKITLYKSQFDTLLNEIYQENRLDRASMDLDALLFRIKYMIKHNRDLDKLDAMKDQFTDKAMEVRKIFGEFLYCFLAKVLGSSCVENIVDLMAQDVKMDPSYVEFTMILISTDQDFLEFVDQTFPEDKPYNLYPDKFFRFYTDSYNDGIAKAYPELFANRHQDQVGTGDDGDVFCHSFTFQTTERCSLNCFAGDTKILMADFSQKYIRDIRPGDVVMGFDEEINEPGKQRRLFPTVVKACGSREADCITVSTPGNSITQVTPDHPYLDGRGRWVKASTLNRTNGVMVIDFDPNAFYDADVDSYSYMYGYFAGGFMGVGSAIEYTDPTDHCVNHFMRFVTKDQEMLERMERYADILGFNLYRTPFQLSKKDNLIIDSLYSEKAIDYEKYMHMMYYVLERQEDVYNDKDLMAGFCAGFYDAKGSIQGGCIRIFNDDKRLLSILQIMLISFGIKSNMEGEGKETDCSVHNIRIVGSTSSVLRFIKIVKPAIYRKGVSALWNRPMYTRQKDFAIDTKDNIFHRKVYNFETESHTYIANGCLCHNCTYCYQFNKTPARMSLEMAKEFIDHLLNDDYGYINRYNSPAIILEFIGGEPLLEITLTRKIYEYFLERCYDLNHPWFHLHRLSICSNGMQYFDEEVQDFFKEYHQNISFNISIDGNRELHDSCRIQPNGEGSYDIDMMALNHYTARYAPERNSKMTLAPTNIRYLFDSVVDFIEKGMRIINLNCVFEEGWNQETAREEYCQLKRLADYLIENELDHLYVAIFNERQENVQDKYHDSSFCGGGGAMLAMRPNGQFYPCIRYMPSSVGDDVADLCIGNVHDGMVGRTENSPVLQMLDRITRRSQSNDICFDCPISNDCANCLALGHTVYGTPNKRTYFTCIQMIAEALANVYYWNRLNLKHPEYHLGVRKNNVPDEWSRLVISDDELEELKLLESASMISTMEHA